MTIILAHGALGWWDEFIFLCVILGFLMMTATSWVRGRRLPSTMQDETAPVSPEQPEQDINAERFEL